MADKINKNQLDWGIDKAILNYYEYYQDEFKFLKKQKLSLHFMETFPVRTLKLKGGKCGKSKFNKYFHLE